MLKEVIALNQKRDEVVRSQIADLVSVIEDLEVTTKAQEMALKELDIQLKDKDLAFEQLNQANSNLMADKAELKLQNEELIEKLKSYEKNHEALLDALNSAKERISSLNTKIDSQLKERQLKIETSPSEAIQDVISETAAAESESITSFDSLSVSEEQALEPYAVYDPEADSTQSESIDPATSMIEQSLEELEHVEDSHEEFEPALDVLVETPDAAELNDEVSIPEPATTEDTLNGLNQFSQLFEDDSANDEDVQASLDQANQFLQSLQLDNDDKETQQLLADDEQSNEMLEATQPVEDLINGLSEADKEFQPENEEPSVSEKVVEVTADFANQAEVAQPKEETSEDVKQSEETKVDEPHKEKKGLLSKIFGK